MINKRWFVYGCLLPVLAMAVLAKAQEHRATIPQKLTSKQASNNGDSTSPALFYVADRQGDLIELQSPFDPTLDQDTLDTNSAKLLKITDEAAWEDSYLSDEDENITIVDFYDADGEVLGRLEIQTERLEEQPKTKQETRDGERQVSLAPPCINIDDYYVHCTLGCPVQCYYWDVLCCEPFVAPIYRDCLVIEDSLEIVETPCPGVEIDPNDGD